MNLNPRRVFEDLAWKALVVGHMTGCPQKRAYERHLRLVQEGKRSPDDLEEHLLPGRLVMKLTAPEREALAGLTADMTLVRDDCVMC